MDRIHSFGPCGRELKGRDVAVPHPQKSSPSMGIFFTNYNGSECMAMKIASTYMVEKIGKDAQETSDRA